MRFIWVLFLFPALSACAIIPNDSPGTNVDRNAIRKVFMDHQKELANCYQSALEPGKNLEGKMVVDFDINQGGKVSRAAIAPERSTLKNEKLGECILTHMRTWQFPESEDQVVSVLYPLAFANNEKEKK